MDLHAIVAEDDLTNASLVAKLLKQMGISSQTFEDSKSVIARLNDSNSKKPDIVIVDLYLKESIGIEICQYMIIDNRFSQVPLLIMSSKFQTSNLSNLASLDCADICIKPLKADEFVEKVGSMLKIQDL